MDDTDDGLIPTKNRKPGYNVVQLDPNDPSKIQVRGTMALHSKTLDHPGFGTANLLHEASHKFAGTIDYMYFNWGGLTPWYPNSFNDKDKALRNADSYGYFILNFGMDGRPKFDWSKPLVL